MSPLTQLFSPQFSQNYKEKFEQLKEQIYQYEENLIKCQQMSNSHIKKLESQAFQLQQQMVEKLEDKTYQKQSVQLQIQLEEAESELYTMSQLYMQLQQNYKVYLL
jgi:hypothetical protein